MVLPDGNGRMSRLLTTKDTYYGDLQSSSVGWHEGENSYEPFVKYYLGIILKAYNEFESRVEYLNNRSFLNRIGLKLS